MNIIMVIFSLVKHENTSKNIRTNWIGFIRQWTGLIRQRTSLIRRRIKPVRRQVKPVRQPIKPVHLVLIYIFFSQLFALCQQRELYHKHQRTKLHILRSYVDLLNHPFQD